MANATPKITEVVYEAENLPSGIILNETTGVISGTPAVEPGTYRPEVTIKTNYGTITEQLVFIMQDSNSPVIYEQSIIAYRNAPLSAYKTRGRNLYVNSGLAVITSPADVEAHVASEFTYQILTNFVDEEKQVYSVSDMPEGMTVDSATGLVSYNVPSVDISVDSSFQFTVGVENSSGETTKVVTATYAIPDDYKPYIDDNQEITVYLDDDFDIEPYTITGRNIDVNAGLATITSPAKTTAELEGTMAYQITTNFVDETKQVYFISDAPSGMTVNEETGEVVWVDIPFVASNPTTFTAGVENSYGTTTKQIIVNLVAPDSWAPIIDDQTLVVTKNAVMTPYPVRGTNIVVNIPEDWEPTIDEQEFIVAKDKVMDPYTIKGSNITVNV